jgi:hypothetical protein
MSLDSIVGISSGYLCTGLVILWVCYLADNSTRPWTKLDVVLTTVLWPIPTVIMILEGFKGTINFTRKLWRSN